ncbi:MAG: prepilin-type N-terminal cleavage/methylation domain-containing protein [Patescibacteria group bacterium]
MHKIVNSSWFTLIHEGFIVNRFRKKSNILPTIYPDKGRTNHRPRTKRGFTLIEILVVVGIMAVLASAILYSTNNAREKGKDARRKGDLQAIATALVAYYADFGHYPPTDTTNLNLDYSSYPYNENWIPDLAPYLQKIPKDPTASLIQQVAMIIKKPFNSLNTTANNLAQSKNVTGRVAAAGSVTGTIVASEDDAKRIRENNEFQNTVTDNPMGHPFECAQTRDSYMRFTLNGPIPKDSTVDSATIAFTPRNDSGVGDNSSNAVAPGFIKSRFRAELSTNAQQIVDGNDWGSRPKTADAGVIKWGANSSTPIPVWYPTPVNPNDLKSPDLKTIIQDLVNQSGWTNSSLHINIYWEDDGTTNPGAYPNCGGRVPVANDGAAVGLGTAPIITINWSTPAPIPDLKGRPESGGTPQGNSINITSGTNARLSWSVANSTDASCSLTGGPTTSSAISMADPPGFDTTNLTATTVYDLTCTGPGGTGSDTLSVNVSATPLVCSPASQTFTLPNANASFAASGGTGTYSWSAPNSSNTTGSGTPFSTSYNTSVGSPFTVTVTSGAQNATCSVIVNPEPPIIPPDLPGGSGTGTACNDKSFIICYRVSSNRKNFVLWIQLENTGDPDIYNSPKDSAVCNDNDSTIVPPPGGSSHYLNYCIRSPR